MTDIGQIERITQNRVVQLLQEKLGYRYLGDWQEREGNSNIEEAILRDWLTTKGNKDQGYSDTLITKALHELKNTAGDQSKKPYDINKDVYSLLRYGVDVRPEIGQNKEQVWLIDWKNPENNDFAFAEEVTVADRNRNHHTKRPDIVLYVNGIALGILELKRSTKGAELGIRQQIDNQKGLFIAPFYATQQLLLAGNDTQGLRYGTTGTPEKYYLEWKEVDPVRNPTDQFLLEDTTMTRDLADQEDIILDRHLIQILNKQRFLELIHDFIVFDAGTKKMCRPNQYFGVKAAQDHIRRREGGIIWHTQGSGKSLTMVWLTKWIRQYNHNARVLIITDRTELDEQIEKVFMGVNEEIYRTNSGRDLIEKLNSNSPWLICSLVHKFGSKEESSEKDMEEYLEQLKNSLPSDFKAKGDLYVFVDECHRTQSGSLHDGMKALLPDALFIGFTGTPLLKNDKKTSLETFGKYIHTYKFDEAVTDGVVLDLRYEARDIEQNIDSHEAIDEWFDLHTGGLNDYAKTELKQRWGTIKKVFSAKSRLSKIVMDIMKDMLKLERLKNGRGNAMLVSDSVYNACRYYELFREAGLKECAIVTSYAPNHNTIKMEDAGMGENEELIKYRIYQKMVADYFNIDENAASGRVKEFEKTVKKKFVEEPGQMKLLIVVDKLLTGFDAPSATFLYIDKSMKDHGLFQAICRVNRLDDESKEYGYVIDYKDLFKSLEQSITDYTSEAFDAYEKEDVDGLLKDRLAAGKERLEDMLETVKALCEPVEPPKGSLQYQHYFVGQPDHESQLEDTAERRHAFYKAVARLVRAYANIADEMELVGYHETTRARIKEEVKYFQAIKDEVMLAAGEMIDYKQYEPGMRQLIDFYLDADQARSLSKLNDMSLVDLIIDQGSAAFDELPEGIKNDKEAMAETIENNLRKVIVEESPTNPAYFEKMSALLDELIRLRKEQTDEYEKYLEDIVKLTGQIRKPEKQPYPSDINTSARRALFDNLGKNAQLAADLDTTIQYTKKDDWRNNKFKTREVRGAIEDVLKDNGIVTPEQVEQILEIAKNQIEY